jgi:hydroxyethylthiazole kinase-like uncharacterized protein yjeF
MLELLTPAEAGEADRAAVAFGAPVRDLMENAGRAAARAIIRRFAPCRVLAGPGNNGGDGYVVARHLARAGWPVAVAALAPPRGVAAEAARDWSGPMRPFAAAEAARAGLVVDALFGAGLARPLDPAAIAVLCAAPRVVAIDVPSGLDGATGQVLGFAPRAELTVTFCRLKPGHLLYPGRDLCGATVLADIALPEAALPAARTWRNHPALWTLPVPSANSHKYTRGHLTVLGGATMTGAARLAALAARRAGVGLLTIACPPGAEAVYRAAEPGNIVRTDPLAALLADPRREVWVCGPGLGETAGAALAALLAAGRTVLADADALTACAGAPEKLRGAAVLTPHGGEFARVFGPPGADRLRAARAAAAATGAVVLLKGPDTLIAAPDGRVAINDNAPPDLATAGAGDVLAGIIGGLLAQGMAPWEAACAGAWLHGDAARLAGPGLIAEDLPGHVPAAVAAALKGRQEPSFS